MIDGSVNTNKNNKTESRAFNYALFLLSKRDYTCAEIRDKLLGKGYDSCVYEKVVSILKKDNYLNDERYCEKYIADKLKHTKYGKNRIKANLFRKGVDKEIISRKIKEINVDEEYIRAFEVGKKKMQCICNKLEERKYVNSFEKIKYKYEQRQKIRAKITAHLISKGFDYKVVNNVLLELMKQM